MLRFAHKYTHMVWHQRHGRVEKVPGKTFAAKTSDDKEFRFHIGQYEAFMMMLQDNYIEPHLFEIVEHELYKPKQLSMRIKAHWILKDYQEEAKTFILMEDASDFHSRLATMPTGTGKTVTAMASVLETKLRTIVAVLPKYMEKWASDIAGIADISPKEIMLVQGAGQVKGLIQMARDKMKLPKFIIMSLTTIQSFFNSYEENRFSDEFKQYGCMPEELCEILDIGNIIVDEAHEHLYSVYRLMMYSHVPKFIALSGTLISDDPFIEKIQHLMFPREIRFDKIKMKKYIKVYPISYVFRDISQSKIRTTEFGSKNYSQIAYEKSIMKRKDLLENYLKLIDYYVQAGYLYDRQPGDKLAIYAGSIAMCTTVTDYLKKKYPQLDVRRYVEQDPYENAIEPDIRVTTILSAGTALDMPGLRVVIMTNNVNAPVPNLQTLGRLREIPDRDVKFFYLYCSEIKKHVDYHHRRMDLFREKVASIKEFKSPIAV